MGSQQAVSVYGESTGCRSVHGDSQSVGGPVDKTSKTAPLLTYSYKVRIK